MFDTALSEAEKQLVLELITCFHIRNDTQHEDGSRGDIKITPKEMNDILAYLMKKVYNDN
jgi:hypothetical protein